MSLAEKMAKEILSNYITVGLLKEVMQKAGISIDAAAAEILERLKNALLVRLDFDDNWLNFLNAPEYATAVEKDGEFIWKAASMGWQAGYLCGWQDRDKLLYGIGNGGQEPGKG